jgi:hypothetical protein
MLTLAEFQRRVSAELLDPLGAANVYPGCESGLATQALAIHRRTVQSVWENALRITFPTLLCLISTEDFRSLAYEYARTHLPRAASLEDFGAAFPEFLAAQPMTQGRRYLIDIARFELALERAAHQPKDIHSPDIPLGSHMTLRILDSVRVQHFDFPVDLIRDAVDAARPEPLAGLDLTPEPRHFAIWRGTTGATVKAFSAASAHFLERLLQDGSAERAVESAVTAANIPAGDVLAAIQSEVFTATFVQLIHPPLTGI